MKLSIIVPVFNEAATVGLALKRLLAAELPCEREVIVVDDGSADGTAAELDAFRGEVRLLRHARNRGKGAAVKTGAAAATGDYLVVFDGDLEYSPDDLTRLVEPVLRGEARVVYGARTFGSSSAHSFWFVIGNKFTTFAANALFNSWIRDMHSCLKLLPLELFRELAPRRDGFGLDTELTALVLRRGIRPFEVPISYNARSHQEGKKITWRDGAAAIAILLQVRLSRQPAAER